MSESVAAEHDYIILSEFPTMKATTMSDKTKTRDNKDQDALNFKATELRLGLPGSLSPERVEARFWSLKSCCAKKVYSDAINGSNKWVFSSGSTAAAGDIRSGSGPAVKDGKPTPFPKTAVSVKEMKVSAAVAAPASKAQVVGWPPIRSFRKNTMAFSQSQKPGGDTNNNSETESKPEACLYVKVSMEGAPYLRKIDLTTYKSYLQLSCALENMFTCFTIGSEYVVTYEDKDSDWMLVGDVPWEMFIGSCKKLRIMKSSDAIGLAPRLMDKCRSRN